MSTKDNYINMSAQSAPELSGDRLDSWKEIAVYLDREVRTVQRWEKREGLPVHRQFHVKAGTVWAFKRDIDAWFNNRCQVVSKAAPEGRLLERSVSWSGPASLDAKGSDQLTERSNNRSEEHTSELQSPDHLVCRLLLEKKKKKLTKQLWENEKRAVIVEKEHSNDRG